MNVINGIAHPNDFREQMKKFIIDNGIIGTAAGVSIALVTKDIIQSFVGDIIMPAFYFVLMSLNVSYFSKNYAGKHTIDVSNFMKQFISWLLVVIITFLFIRVAFGMLFGINDDKSLPK